MTLLQRLPNAADAEAWEAFVQIYAPVVFGFAVKRGCPASEAADLVQEVLVKVADAIRRFDYNPSKGKFRNWLFTIARNHLLNWQRKARSRPYGVNHPEWTNSALSREPDSRNDHERVWELEYQRQIVYGALPAVEKRVSAAQWNVFQAMVIEDEPPPKVAERLGMSLGSLYVAKSRVLAILREEIQFLEQEWDDALPQATA